jgi:hypothetical protein
MTICPQIAKANRGGQLENNYSFSAGYFFHDKRHFDWIVL